MPNSEDYVELNLSGLKMRIKNVAWKGERLRAEFGGGYSAAAVVGAASGLHRFSISASVQPDTSIAMVSSQTYFDYLYDFFIARTTGAEERFMVQWRSKYWHVVFAEPEMSFEAFKSSIYSLGGLELMQCRVANFSSYDTDGSIILV